MANTEVILPPSLKIKDAGRHANIQGNYRFPASAANDFPGYATTDDIQVYVLGDIPAQIGNLQSNVTNLYIQVNTVANNLTRNVATLVSSINVVSSHLAANVAYFDARMDDLEADFANLEVSINVVANNLSDNIAWIEGEFDNVYVAIETVANNLLDNVIRIDEWVNSIANDLVDNVAYLENLIENIDAPNLEYLEQAINTVAADLVSNVDYLEALIANIETGNGGGGSGNGYYGNDTYYASINGNPIITVVNTDGQANLTPYGLEVGVSRVGVNFFEIGDSFEVVDDRMVIGAGDSNVVINSSSISLFSNDASLRIRVPSNTQIANGQYFFNANGSYVRVRQDFIPAGSLSTDVTLGDASNTDVPSEYAVKTYVDSLLGGDDVMSFRGNVAGGANYPSANAGDVYLVTSNGQAGIDGPNVWNNDLLLCISDGANSDAHTEVGGKWRIIRTNSINRPANGAANGGFVQFLDSSGYLVQGGLFPTQSIGANSNTAIPTERAVKVWTEANFFPVANVTNDETLVSNSANEVPTVQAVKTYIATQPQAPANGIGYETTPNSEWGNTVQAAVDWLLANKQPLDGDLTAIANLSTTEYGRSLLEMPNAEALFGEADLIYQPLDSDLTAIANLTTTDFGRSLLTLANVAVLASNLVSANVFQPVDSDLTSIAALTTTNYGRGLLTLANAAALASEANAQPLHPFLTALGGSNAASNTTLTSGIIWKQGTNTAFVKAVVAGSNNIVVTSANASANLIVDVGTAIKTSTLLFEFNGGGEPIPEGSNCDIYLDFNCAVNTFTAFWDNAASNVIFNIWSNTYANYPPDISSNIALISNSSSVIKIQGTANSVNGWGTANLASGSVVRVNFPSNPANSVYRATLALTVTKT